MIECSEWTFDRLVVESVQIELRNDNVQALKVRMNLRVKDSPIQVPWVWEPVVLKKNLTEAINELREIMEKELISIFGKENSEDATRPKGIIEIGLESPDSEIPQV